MEYFDQSDDFEKHLKLLEKTYSRRYPKGCKRSDFSGKRADNGVGGPPARRANNPFARKRAEQLPPFAEKCLEKSESSSALRSQDSPQKQQGLQRQKELNMNMDPKMCSISVHEHPNESYSDEFRSSNDLFFSST